MAALAQGETLDLTQFGHSLYHTFLNYCRLPAGKGKSPPPVHNGAPKMSQNQLTRLVADLGLLAPNGPVSPHILGVIHASYKPLGSSSLTFGTFLQAMAAVSAEARVPPDQLFAELASLASSKRPWSAMPSQGSQGQYNGSPGDPGGVWDSGAPLVVHLVPQKGPTNVSAAMRGLGSSHAHAAAPAAMDLDAWADADEISRGAAWGSMVESPGSVFLSRHFSPYSTAGHSSGRPDSSILASQQYTNGGNTGGTVMARRYSASPPRASRPTTAPPTSPSRAQQGRFAAGAGSSTRSGANPGQLQEGGQEMEPMAEAAAELRSRLSMMGRSGPLAKPSMSDPPPTGHSHYSFQSGGGFPFFDQPLVPGRPSYALPPGSAPGEITPVSGGPKPPSTAGGMPSGTPAVHPGAPSTPQASGGPPLPRARPQTARQRPGTASSSAVAGTAAALQYSTSVGGAPGGAPGPHLSRLSQGSTGAEGPASAAAGVLSQQLAPGAQSASGASAQGEGGGGSSVGSPGGTPTPGGMGTPYSYGTPGSTGTPGGLPYPEVPPYPYQQYTFGSSGHPPASGSGRFASLMQPQYGNGLGGGTAYQAMPPPWAEQVLERLGVLEAQIGKSGFALGNTSPAVAAAVAATAAANTTAALAAGGRAALVRRSGSINAPAGSDSVVEGTAGAAPAGSPVAARGGMTAPESVTGASTAGDAPEIRLEPLLPLTGSLAEMVTRLDDRTRGTHKGVEHLAAKLDATSTSLRAALSASAAEQTLALTAHQAASAKALLSVQEDLVNKIQQQGVQLQGLKDQSTKSTSAASVKAESAQAAADRLSALVRALEASHEETGGAVKGLVKDTERLETQVAALKLGRSEIDDELRKLTASKDSQGASMLDIVTRLGALERAVTAAASEKSRLAPLLQQQPQDAPVKGGSEGLSAESHQQHHHLKAAVSAAVSAATASVAAQVAAMATSMEAMQARLRVVETRGPAHEALDTLIHRVGQLEQSKAGGVPSGYGQPGSLSAMPSTANLEAQAAEVAAATQKADSAAALALAESAEIRAVQEALTSKVATLEATLKQLSEKVAGASASVAASAYTTPALSTRPSLGIPPASDKGAEELQSHLLALDRRLEEATQQLQRRITDAEADAGRAMQKLKAMLAPALAANQRVDQVETSVKGLTDQVAQLQQAAQSAGDGAAVAQAALEAAAAAKAAASKVEDQALGWGVQLQELAEKLAHLQSNAAAVAPSARSTYTGDAAGGEAGTLHSPPHVHQSAHSVSSVASSALVHPSELSFAQGMGVQQRPGTASGGLAGIDSASLPPPGVASRVTALETEVNAKLPRIEAQLAEALPLLAKLPRVEIDVGELSLAISKAPAEAAQALSKVTALESELAAKLPQVEAQLTHAQQLLGRMPQLESLVAELQAALNRSTSAAAEAGSRDNGLVKEHKAETASQPATAASEAQLNSRLNQLESQLMSKLPQLESQVTSRLPELEAQLESLLPQLQSQLTQAEAQSSDVSSKLVQLGSQLASQQKLIARLPDLETALGTLQASAEKVLALDERLSKLAASSEAIEAALSSKVAALQVQLSQLAAATAEASATAEAASASAQEALTAWQSKAPGGASKAGSKVAASSSVASSSQAGGKSSAGGGAGESISSLPSAVHDVGKAALQARMSDVEERLGELTQRERADMEAIQSQLAAVQQSPRMDPEAVDRMQALERDLVKVNTVLVNLVSKVEEMQQQQAGGHAGLPADWGAALSEAQAKVSELETKVAEMVAKGPKGVVAREEMMRALGAITTDLSGRIKDVREVALSTSGRNTPNTQPSTLPNTRPGSRPLSATGRPLDSSPTQERTSAAAGATVEELARAIALAKIEAHQEVEALRAEVHELKASSGAAGVPGEVAAAALAASAMAAEVEQLKQAQALMGHMTAQRLDAIETRLQSVLEEASSLMSASMGGLASGMQQRGTEGGAAEMAETKKTVDTLQGKVNELSSALVMVVEKLNRRLAALEEGRVSLSAQPSDLGRPLSPRGEVHVNPAPSLAKGLAGSTSYRNAPPPPPTDVQFRPSGGQVSFATMEEPRASNSGYSAFIRDGPNSQPSASRGFAIRPKSARDKVALLVSEKQAENRAREEKLKADEERVKAQRMRSMKSKGGGSGGGATEESDGDDRPSPARARPFSAYIPGTASGTSTPGAPGPSNLSRGSTLQEISSASNSGNLRGRAVTFGASDARQSPNRGSPPGRAPAASMPALKTTGMSLTEELMAMKAAGEGGSGRLLEADAVSRGALAGDSLSPSQFGGTPQPLSYRPSLTEQMEAAQAGEDPDDLAPKESLRRDSMDMDLPVAAESYGPISPITETGTPAGLSPPLLSPGQPGGALGARLSGNGGHASPSAAPMFGTGGSVFGVGGSVFGASGPSLDSVGPSIGGGGVSLGGAGPTFGAMLTDPGVQARASGGSGGLRSPLHSQGGATSEYAALLQSRASGDGNQIGARLSGGGGGLAPAGPSLDAPLSAAASGERGFHSRLGAGGGNGQGLMALGGSSMQGSAPVRPANAAMLMMQNRGLMGVSPRASNSGTTAGGAGAGADRMRKL